jgi:D-glycero-D-manno-heptose 1,7-bisphosphate phosphatase
MKDGPTSAALRPALFLDRDGVINIDRGYVCRVEDFVFVPGIFDLVAAASQRHLPVVVATNQAGIGRGLYGEIEYSTLTRWMCERFAERGTPLAAVYHCPTHPEAGIGRYRVESPERKPAPGMLLRAARDHGLDLSRSVLVGDKMTDIMAGEAAGLSVNLLLHDGPQPPVGSVRPRAILQNVAEAIAWLPTGMGAVGSDVPA